MGLLLLLVGWSVPHAAGAATVRGRVLHGRAGIGGAVVVAANARHHAVGETGSDGAFHLTVPNGTYRLSSSAPGFRVSIATGVNVRRSEVRDIVLTSSGLALTRAPLFGGGRSVVADGTPGVFYIAGDNVGDLYRTLDWGGTWTPVTVRRDDGAHGLGDVWGPGLLTTSGSPGEVAVCLFDGSTFYSTDYGVTWHALTGGPSTPGRILWGHAGAVSVLAAGGDGQNYVADMTAPHPEFVKMTTPYVSSVNRPVGVGNGADRPWLATVNSAGHLLVYPLVAQREAPSPAIDVPGFNAGGSEPPVYVALGGKSAPGEPPAGVMVAGLDWIAMSLKAPAAHTYPSPSAIGVGLNLNGHPGGLPCFTTSPPGGYPSLTPNTSEVYGAGWVNGCWVQDRSGTLTVERGLGARAAIDAGYNTSDTASGGDAVVMEEPLAPDMSSGGEIGVAKLAATTDGFPSPLSDRTLIAQPGLGARSAGIAETGIDAGTVHQTIVLPQGAAAASDVGGTASDDGGRTFRRTTWGNTWSVASWQGASGRWLLFGQNAFGANHNLVGAFLDWTHTTALVAGGNVSGSTAADFAGREVPPGVVHVDAIAGVPGQDRAFVGATYDGTIQNGPPEAALVRVGLVAGPAFSDRTQIGSDVITKPGPIAYCPAAGSAAPSGDVLDGDQRGLLRWRAVPGHRRDRLTGGDRDREILRDGSRRRPAGPARRLYLRHCLGGVRRPGSRVAPINQRRTDVHARVGARCRRRSCPTGDRSRTRGPSTYHRWRHRRVSPGLAGRRADLDRGQRSDDGCQLGRAVRWRVWRRYLGRRASAVAKRVRVDRCFPPRRIRAR